MNRSDLFFRDLVGLSAAEDLWGETTPAIALLDHFHTPRSEDPANRGTFRDGAVKKLEVADMNPGFVSAADALVTDTSSTGLHHCLGKMLTSQFSSYLHGGGASGASSHDKIAIALVDLGGNRLTRPEFAGWGSTVAYGGASTPKILPVYAVFQLRADLRHLARTESITDPDRLRERAVEKWRAAGLTRGLPYLRWLFDLSAGANLTALELSSNAKALLGNVNGNSPMGELIVKVGFRYIASLVIQSGLFHPTRGGLWLRAAYSGKGSWSGRPPGSASTPYSLNLTALSTATYFTLLAQRRLVDPATSVEIESVLSSGCRTSWFPSSLAPHVRAAKCGIVGKWLHVPALIERGTQRFVAMLATKNFSSASDFAAIWTGMDTLVTNDNRSPKVPC
jgi:hypothetical protein